MSQPFTTGNRIRVLRPDRRSHYEVGKIYIVESVDDDRTLRARCPRTGKVGGWISFDDIELANVVGWRFLQQALSPETVRLLRAFDGVEHLTLREPIKDQLLLRVDNLAELLCEEAERLDSEHPAQSYRSLGPDYNRNAAANEPRGLPPSGDSSNNANGSPQPVLAEQLRALFHGDAQSSSAEASDDE